MYSAGFDMLVYLLSAFYCSDQENIEKVLSIACRSIMYFRVMLFVPAGSGAASKTLGIGTWWGLRIVHQHGILIQRQISAVGAITCAGDQ